ncbi:probable C-mannosyltransferase DPY19L3 isoform X1 [Syngnathus typhle]|uniref:probable C-mannosyltransferase DPY19L3 isoform X1 n=1 Tax=Syngnathus typhle TaxID=161592 RepID=UPI002A69D4E7|nr:probable C-mannosyltransferase DPY19L3 isoform X1 [Syngnathus typhle]XP_061132499.1 probable C-mannosyltransferase DPY19L3 isoform X1 [Syngnathus typhle]XP_061132500.1 probable C-mannosyltransferase DPY19L3 isoform X1 [Syngnathus typhle]
MAALRHRKGSRAKCPPQSTAADWKPQQPHQSNCCPQHHHHHQDDLLQGDWSWGSIVCTSVGWSVSVGLGLLCCMYMATLHENDLWFSNIKEVEREISFRTECGLYYSYYKQMLNAPSIQEGLSELIHDNLTESKRTINLLQRMNIYQEVLLSILYRLLPIQSYLEPMYFYIYSVFSLQAVYVMALYLTAWLLAGSWTAGALAAIWYILNRVDTTRVEFTISLRENWSLPFLALQVAAITCYLRPRLGALQQKVMVWLMFVCSLCFCVTWQFNQFIFLVQALVVYTLDCVDVLTTAQVTTLYLVQVSALLSVWLLQFFNGMILGSLVLSFIAAALLVRHVHRSLKTGGFAARVFKLIIHSTAVLLLAFTFNFLTKKALRLRSDEHIFKFIKSKFARGPTRDFDANLYLCEEAFGALPLDTLERLSASLLLGPYALTLVLMGGALALAALRNLRTKGGAAEGPAVASFRPDVAYNLLHTLFYGLLALSTMRMKYIWTGHMCAVAAYGVCGRDVWAVLLHALRCKTKVTLTLVRYAAPAAVLAFLSYKFWPKMVEELSDLREFYDPDTVELMTWISTKTPGRAVLAGSMQLLAGIKLCTGRIITNHPHYEDADLRDRTKQVYQVYARRSPQDVHAILQGLGAHYVVLENSICYERRHRRGCRLRDLLDLANGHIMDGEGANDADLVAAAHPRFCDAVKTDSPEYAALFKRTFQNKTFHVYRVKKKAKKNS